MALHTFSCSIFKCLLISETSPSLEEEENSEKADDSDAAVVFDSGLLLRISDALMHPSHIWPKRISHRTVPPSTIFFTHR